jgi:hypothetical protein
MNSSIRIAVVIAKVPLQALARSSYLVCRQVVLRVFQSFCIDNAMSTKTGKGAHVGGINDGFSAGGHDCRDKIHRLSEMVECRSGLDEPGDGTNVTRTQRRTVGVLVTRGAADGGEAGRNRRGVALWRPSVASAVRVQVVVAKGVTDGRCALQCFGLVRVRVRLGLGLG